VISLLGVLLALLIQPPATPVIVDTPGVTLLKGLTVQEFEAEMQLMTTALGASCGTCHTRGNFASDANPRKATARRMIEMVQGINKGFFAEHTPAAGESRLGKVTCFTCHQGELKPKTPPPL
jgi:hypothetical protein